MKQTKHRRLGTLLTTSLAVAAWPLFAAEPADPVAPSPTMAPVSASGWASVAGSANPGDQVIVLGLDGNKLVVGVMGQADGTYRVTQLPPGRYAIKVEGPHHAARTLTLEAGKVGEVDLASSQH